MATGTKWQLGINKSLKTEKKFYRRISKRPWGSVV
jgi:hypothetical protein